ncbi:MAG: copper amine oxidase N-terminal domain-containing protein [Bacillota bacterium]|jgi:hypothetical protein
MKNWHKKKKVFLLVCVLAGVMTLAIPVLAYSSTLSDPLVSKSWVDQYINNKFAAIEQDLDKLEADLNKYKQETSRHIVLYLGKKEAFVNEKITLMDTTPAVKNNFIMVPLRFIGESLNIKVDWNNQTKTVTCQSGVKKVILQLFADTAVVNGKTVSLSCSPMAVNGRILLPTRFIAESLGCTVNWDNNLKRVDIYR